MLSSHANALYRMILRIEVIFTMDYDYNRRAFRSVCSANGIEPLAAAYCGCILLELSLKQYLALCTSGGNGGHNLPDLLLRVGLRNPSHTATLNSLQRQLAGSLRILFSQGKDGLPTPVPTSSYPFIRYLRHDSDWGTSNSSDVDITLLTNVLQRITSFLTASLGVAV